MDLNYTMEGDPEFGTYSFNYTVNLDKDDMLRKQVLKQNKTLYVHM
jgi:hypothetical protein